MKVYKIFTDAGAKDEWFSGEFADLNSWVGWSADESEAKLFTLLETAENYLRAGRHTVGSSRWEYAEIVTYELVKTVDTV
jgi:hypothetical protein